MKFAIVFSYLGKNYKGYQLQPSAPSVQAEIESALKQITNQDIKIYASGRTDKEVSAIKQVAHFNCDKNVNNFAKRLNGILPNDIRIREVVKVSNDFHARYDCISKTYEYSFYHSDCNIPYLDEFALYCKKPYNLHKMKEGAKYLLGEHDFTSFCASGGSAIDKVREITKVAFTTNHLGVHTFSISGKSFLYNMVRIIMGTLLDVGYGKLQPCDIEKIIFAKNRRVASETVSGKALVLVNVEYNNKLSDKYQNTKVKSKQL